MSIILVGCMQLCLAWSIENAGWVPGLTILTPVVLGGVAVGAVLSAWRWMPVLVAHGWSAVIGTACTFYLATGLVSDYQSAPAGFDALPLTDRLAYVRNLYLAWPNVARSGMPLTSDQSDMMALFFTITMALLLWLLAYICTWFAERYISWSGAVLPSGFALVFSLYSARLNGYAAYIGFFMLCAFLLAARTHIALRLERWQAERIHHGSGMEFDFLRDSLVVAAVAIAVAFVLPGRIQSAVLRDLPATWSAMSERTRKLSGRYFPNLNYPIRGEGNSFGNAMPLTGSIELGSQPVFDVELDGQNGVPARYFRMAVFDTWDGQGWRRTPDNQRTATALEPVGDAWAASRAVTQTVRTLKPGVTQLYALAAPDRFDIPTTLEVAASGRDVLAIESGTALPQGGQYSVWSNLSAASTSELQGAERAGDPDWVAARYLQLPESVPQRVRDLAVSIAGEEPTRWDKAKAIESYLRRSMRYTETIPDPPRGQDKADWFLFDIQQGYCDYYSTSFVVLARSLGIPARLAAGYAGGEQLGTGTARRLHDFDAHTWPEVFFADYGWIEFEPTANEQALDRPATADDARQLASQAPPASGDSARPPEDLLPEEDQRPPAAEQSPERGQSAALAAKGFGRWWPLLAVITVVAAIAAGGRWWWQRPLAGMSAAERSYGRVVRVARWLGVGPTRAETPSEYSRRLSRKIPEADEEISTITRAYVAERFGRQPSDGLSDRLEAAWQKVRRIGPSTVVRTVRERWIARRSHRSDGTEDGSA
ncbi:MAG: DUF4129 domain-containing protein [Ardenticatenales bacterium]|nr:DUF4129 domain-containing protein [Ardenticatenales bacterium]